MKDFKFLMMLIVLAMGATACSKGGGGGAPAAQDRYYYQGNYCYDRNTGQRISNVYCDDDNYNNGGYENACVGWVIYASPSYVDAVDCTNPNSYYVECRDPRAYARNGETVTCMDTGTYNNSYGNYNNIGNRY